MSDKELYRCLVQAALDPGFRSDMIRNPEKALDEFALDDSDRETLLSRDGRLISLIGRALRTSEDFQKEDAVDVSEPKDETPEFSEIIFPPISLTLRVRPYASRDSQGRFTVNYSAHILTGSDTEREPQPSGIEGQPLSPLDLNVFADVTGLQESTNGEIYVRYDLVAEPPALTDLNEGPDRMESLSGQAELCLNRAPHPWVHRVNARDVQDAAKEVRSAPIGERFAKLSTLVRALTKGDMTPLDQPTVSSGGVPDIWVVGLGIKAGVQLTTETCDVLKRVNEVLFVDTGVGTRELLESFCPNVRSLFSKSYTESDHRLTAYQHMAVLAVEAALSKGPVAFAMQGHPVVGAYAPVLIHDLAITLGLNVRILPGISHLDALFSELLFDPFVQGLQAYEATDLLLRRRPLRAEVPALIFQVGNVETRLYTERISLPERFHRLSEHLRLFYPPDHLVQAVYASPHPLASSSGITFKLSHIGDYADMLHPGVTLFIPPVCERPIVDPILATQIDSHSHLKNITREL